MYKDYLQEKYGYHFIEESYGFLALRFLGEECNIGEIYVKPEHRNSKLTDSLYKKARASAILNRCKYLSCQTELTGNSDEASIRTILKQGFKPVVANNNKIIYTKELV